MSSCGGFCCTCCHVASYVSATSASSPTAAVPACCLSASNCYVIQPNRRHQQRQSPRLNRCHFGAAHVAVEPCVPSNESPRLNCCFVLHPTLPGAQHELLSCISTTLRATTRTGKRCAIWPPATPCGGNCSSAPTKNGSSRPPPAPRVTEKRTRSGLVPHPLAASAHSNYISVRRRSGFLHVAVSKAPSLQCRGASKSLVWALQIRPKDISVQTRTSTLTSLSWRTRTENGRCTSFARMAMR